MSDKPDEPVVDDEFGAVNLNDIEPDKLPEPKYTIEQAIPLVIDKLLAHDDIRLKIRVPRVGNQESYWEGATKDEIMEALDK